jgi:oxygen-independent coproporphyrinogen-3 oxidase
MSLIRIYIHIPFCLSKCHYCGFNSYAGLDHLHEAYVKALAREMALVGKAEGPLEAVTVYLGGGTPTTLSLDLLAEILGSCREHFPLAKNAEISIEANPGTVDADYLSALRKLGMNRLSLGAQSFSDQMLALLGRVHTADETRDTYRLGQQAGFENINLDLIYSLPGQTFSQWRSDLSEVIALQPEHLSLYCLSLEEGTPLAKMISAGKLPHPDLDLAAEMYSWAERSLDKAGYEHYEISNWARTGYECQHNITYWRNRPYLGFGAGAHSFQSSCRYHNVLSPEEYVKLILAGQSPLAGREEIDTSLEMSETMIMGLRLCKGVSFEEFEERFHCSVLTVYGDQMRELVGQGLLDMSDKGVKLTARGRLLGNEVFERFLAG